MDEQRVSNGGQHEESFYQPQPMVPGVVVSPSQPQPPTPVAQQQEQSPPVQDATQPQAPQMPVTQTMPTNAMPPVVQSQSMQAVAPTELAIQPARQVENVQPQAPIAESAYTQPSASITWTAAEYVENAKSKMWYVAAAVVSVVIAAAVWLITRDLFPSIAVFVGILLFIVYSGRKPRTQSYAIDQHGLMAYGKHYDFREFKSFAIMMEGGQVRVDFAPLKRFALDVSMYLDPKQQDAIVSHISQYLPMEQPRNTMTDNLMSRLRF